MKTHVNSGLLVLEKPEAVFFDKDGTLIDIHHYWGSMIKIRADLICERLNSMPNVSCNIPTGAFYVFPKFDIPGYTSEDLAMKMLEGGVLCSPGTAFGKAGEGHLRFAYTICQEDISRGMDRVEAILSNLDRS